MLLAIFRRCNRHHRRYSHPVHTICWRAQSGLKQERFSITKLPGLLWLWDEIHICPQWLGRISHWCDSLSWCLCPWTRHPPWQVLPCRRRISKLPWTSCTILWWAVPPCWVGMCSDSVSLFFFSLLLLTCDPGQSIAVNTSTYATLSYTTSSNVSSVSQSSTFASLSSLPNMTWIFKHGFPSCAAASTTLFVPMMAPSWWRSELLIQPMNLIQMCTDWLLTLFLQLPTAISWLDDGMG